MRNVTPIAFDFFRLLLCSLIYFCLLLLGANCVHPLALILLEEKSGRDKMESITNLDGRMFVAN